jgi:hypothetical protein
MFRSTVRLKYQMINRRMTTTDYLKRFTSFKLALQRSPKAKTYAENRHLDLNRLEVGYNSGSTYKQACATMKHCLIFPLKNQSGDITSFYGRSILDKNRCEALLYKEQNRLISKISGRRNRNSNTHRIRYRCSDLNTCQTTEYLLLNTGTIRNQRPNRRTHRSNKTTPQIKRNNPVL